MKKQSNNKTVTRVGFGFDSHLFSFKGTLVLGGLSFHGVSALKGHSDGDAVLHAIIDALLGAAGEGDIGDLFSDHDQNIKGISSRVMLSGVLARIKKKGFRPHQEDLTIVADKPRLTLHKANMGKLLSGLLGLSSSDVNVKAKTQEGLNLFKRPGGIAVYAVVLINGGTLG